MKGDEMKVFIVDGYNLLQYLGLFGEIQRGAITLAQAREETVMRVQLNPGIRRDVKIFFDSSRGLTETEVFSLPAGNEMEIIFCPDADLGIRKLAKDKGGELELTVVTADNELGRKLKKLGSKVVQPGSLFPGSLFAKR